MLILSLLAIKLYRFFLAFFVRFWKQMQCIVSQPLPFLVLQNAYLVAKIQIYIGLEQTIILKNIIPQLLFSIILIAPLHISSCCNLFRYKCNPYFYQLFVRLQFLYCANGLQLDLFNVRISLLIIICHIFKDKVPTARFISNCYWWSKKIANFCRK